MVKGTSSRGSAEGSIEAEKELESFKGYLEAKV